MKIFSNNNMIKNMKSNAAFFFTIVAIVFICLASSSSHFAVVDAAAADWAWTYLWTFNAGSAANRPVVLPNGFAAVASRYSISGFNATIGGDLFWEYQGPVDQGTNIGAAIIVDGGAAGRYVVTSMSSGVYVVNQSDGKHICDWWTRTESDDLLSAHPIPYKNTFLAGLQNSENAADGKVYQIDPATCTHVWTINTPSGNGVYGSLTISKSLDTIYWCDSTGSIVSVRIGGTEEQCHIIPNSCTTQGGQMAEKDGVIYTMAPGGYGVLLKILASSGQKLWQFESQDQGRTSNGLAMWNNELVFASTRTKMFGLNVDGHPAILNWTLNEAMTGSPQIFGDDPEQNARSNGRFAEFYGQVASAGDSSDHFFVLSPFTGVELWRGYISGNGFGGGVTFWNGTVIVPDGSGNLLAFAPCAAYDERDCPLACLAMKGGCGCALADENSCNSGIVSRRCQWCPSQNMCGRRAHVDDNGVHLPGCDCSGYNYDTCIQAQANNGCKWCPSQNICSNTNISLKDFNFNCDCRTYTDELCTIAVANGNSCRFCAGSTDRCTAPWDMSCDCLLIPDQFLCDQANQAVCNWCNNSKTCSAVVPLQNQTADPTCSCNNFNKSICTGLASVGCTWCSFGGIEVCSESCSCATLDQDVCLLVGAQDKGMCHFCADELQTCYPKSQPCSCDRLSKEDCNQVYQQTGTCGYCTQFQMCVSLVNATSGNRSTIAEACKCYNFNKAQCRLAYFNIGTCKFCEDFDNCIDTTETCSCEAFPVSDCATSFKAGVCHVCPEQGVCTSVSLNPNCSCSYYPPSTCKSIPASQCTYCANTERCQSNADSASTKYPACSCYSYDGDWETCKIATGCAIYQGVYGVSAVDYVTNISESTAISADRATRGSPFCAPASLAQCAPTSCTAIGSNADLCRIAGCRYDRVQSTSEGHDQCQSASKCFYYFLYTLVPQSWFMLLFGLVKDVIVLIILGATDWIQRSSAKVVHAVTRRMKKMWVGESLRDQLIPDRMHETVYICDQVARDAEKYQGEDFSSYVVKICDELFYWSSEPTPLMKQKLFDAVAFSLITNQRWVSIGDDGSTDNDDDENGENDQTINNNNNNGGGDDDQENDGEAAALMTNNNNNSSNNKKNKTNKNKSKNNSNDKENGDTFETVVKRKRKLRPQTLERNEPEFFRIVDVVVEARTSYFIFYSHSRSMSKRISSSINLFPDTNTLVFYVAGIIIMIVSAILSVLRTDQQILNSMTNSCGKEANYTNGVFFPPSASDSNTNNNNNDYSSSPPTTTTSTSVATFFLVGYRFMNASSWATAVLVFVKFVRGLAQSRSSQGTLSNLTIEKKIPILTVKYSRAVQGLLCLYAILTWPFALSGLVYGWPSRGWVCGVPILVGLGGILVDYILIRCFSQEADDPFESSEVGDADDVGDRLQNKNNNKDASKNSSPGYGATASSIQNTTKNNQERPAVEEASKKKKKQSLLNDDDDDDGGCRDNDGFDSRSDSKTEELVMSPKQESGAVAVPTATSKNNKKSGGDDTEINSDHDSADDEGSSLTKKKSELYADIQHVQHDLDRQKRSTDSLLRAILFFVLSQELPTVILALALQLSFNYTALLQYPQEFALTGDNANQVFYRDAGGRSVSCTINLFEGDISAIMSDLSTFLPFM